MATCIQSINLMPSYLGLEQILPSTLTPFSFTPTVNKLFRLSTLSPISVLFNISLVPSGTPVIAAQLAIYKFNGSAATSVLVGTINLNNPTMSFSRDFEFGNYILCFRSLSGSYSAQVTGFFTTYPTTSFMSVRFSHGENLQRPEMGVPPLPSPCEEPLFYEILDGELPPGLVMNSLGIIEGTLPNLDCIDETKDYSPSINWFYQDSDGVYQPWGLRWRFKVKMFIASMPDVFQEAWFCIKIHNNWSYDRDNFIEQAPFDRTRRIEIVQEPTLLPKNVCYVPCDDDKDTVIFKPQKIQDPGCDTCDGNPVDVILVPIPQILKQKPITEIAKWYEKFKDEIFESKDLKQFAERLKQTEAWKLYLQQIAFTDEERLNNGKIIVANVLNDALQISIISPYRDVEELPDMMERLRLIQNETLPFTLELNSGETFSATMS